jgi:uncharacterized protein YbaP (TraB family)
MIDTDRSTIQSIQRRRPSTGLLLGIVFLFFLTSFQVSGSPFLWEVRHPKKPGSVYLAGSIHVLRRTDKIPPLYETAFSQTDRFIFETDVDDQRIAALVQARALLPARDSLKNYLDPGTYGVIESYLIRKRYARLQFPGQDPVHFSQLQPWVAYSLISELRARDSKAFVKYGMDAAFMRRARANKKHVEFFETP